jgi:hypothetical protein
VFFGIDGLSAKKDKIFIKIIDSYHSYIYLGKKMIDEYEKRWWLM